MARRLKLFCQQDCTNCFAAAWPAAVRQLVPYATPLSPPGPPPQAELLSDIRSYLLFSQLDTTRLVLTAQSALLYPPPLCAQSSPSPCVSPLWTFVARPTPQMSLPPPRQPPQPFVLLAWVMHTWVIAPWTAVLKRHVGKEAGLPGGALVPFGRQLVFLLTNKRWVLSTGRHALPERRRSEASSQ